MDDAERGRIAKALIEIHDLVDGIAHELYQTKAKKPELPKTRQEARQQGSLYYMTGRACIHGHIDARYTGNADCRKCQITNSRNTRLRKQRRKLVMKPAEVNDALRASNHDDHKISDMTERVAEHLVKKAWLESLTKLLDE